MLDLDEILRKSKNIVICGIGNDMRGDDAFGVIVADRLRDTITRRDVLIINCGEVPESYVGKIREFKPEAVVFIDAVDFGGNTGEVIVTDPEGTMGDAISTHSLPLRVLVRYLKETLPGTKFILIGCQPASTGFMEEPCESVKKAADNVTAYLRKLLEF